MADEAQRLAILLGDFGELPHPGAFAPASFGSVSPSNPDSASAFIECSGHLPSASVRSRFLFQHT